MKLDTGWGHCEFVAEDEEDATLLKQLYEKLEDEALDDVYPPIKTLKVADEGEVSLVIVTYF